MYELQSRWNRLFTSVHFLFIQRTDIQSQLNFAKNVITTNGRLSLYCYDYKRNLHCIYERISSIFSHEDELLLENCLSTCHECFLQYFSILKDDSHTYHLLRKFNRNLEEFIFSQYGGRPSPNISNTIASQLMSTIPVISRLMGRTFNEKFILLNFSKSDNGPCIQVIQQYCNFKIIITEILLRDIMVSDFGDNFIKIRIDPLVFFRQRLNHVYYDVMLQQMRKVYERDYNRKKAKKAFKRSAVLTKNQNDKKEFIKYSTRAAKTNFKCFKYWYNQ
ncbi:hypothetical protein FDP41_010595 [Naegleria fowleri]|uniref:Uncharacterized protein n=1 Tax=Naegleria fowleri TaxID=5763 RepID=A0A6A5CD43_NAEFO|nr:uncharacterized protein FDP41_010595 [Naegleria fowleri]KAF0983530.1 hypothetical protein FDP41_010595 [Naegleria fowleri]CAG4711425.1 unnamed protein product [Naegleria fowleri]